MYNLHCKFIHVLTITEYKRQQRYMQLFAKIPLPVCQQHPEGHLIQSQITWQQV